MRRFGRTRGIIGALVAAFAAACLAPTPASALNPNATKTQIIGSDLGPVEEPPNGGERGEPGVAVAVQWSRSSNVYPLLSPVNGRVTNWKFRATAGDAAYVLWILRPHWLLGPGAPVGVGASASEQPHTNNLDTIWSYDTSLPIKKGDTIGVRVAGSPRNLPQHVGAAPPGDYVGYASPPPILGVEFGTTGWPRHELYLQATVTYCTVPPVKDKMVQGAKKKIRNAGCTAKVRRKSSSKPAGRVLKQRAKAGETRDPEDPVKIIVSR